MFKTSSCTLTETTGHPVKASCVSLCTQHPSPGRRTPAPSRQIMDLPAITRRQRTKGNDMSNQKTELNDTTPEMTKITNRRPSPRRRRLIQAARATVTALLGMVVSTGTPASATQATDGDLGRKRGHRRLRPRVIRLACTIAGVAAVAVTSLPAVTNAATPSAYAQACYSTIGLTSCIESTESWNGSSAGSTGRFYWCSNVPLAISDCHNHLEGSYWNGALGAWEDWANVSYKTAISPNVKFCVYLRLDVRPNGQHWSRAWASGPLPLWQGC